jgi:hypothetical protein
MTIPRREYIEAINESQIEGPFVSLRVNWWIAGFLRAEANANEKK